VYRAEEVRTISGIQTAMQTEQNGESYVLLFTYFSGLSGHVNDMNVNINGVDFFV
jgi:hypothetical protein